MKTIKNDIILFLVMLAIGLIGFNIIGAQFSGQDTAVDTATEIDDRTSMVDVSNSLTDDPSNIEGGDLAERQVESMLKNRADAWNIRDLDRYMADYRKFDLLRVSVNGKTAKGWEDVRQSLANKFGPGMGTLRIGNMKINIVGDFASIVTADWNLQQENKITNGRMNLVMKKIDGDWKITTENLTEN